MTEKKGVFARWKEEHWDIKPDIDNRDPVFFLSISTPWPRRVWEKHRGWIKQVFIWLLALIAGGVITKLLGLA